MFSHHKRDGKPRISPCFKTNVSLQGHPQSINIDKEVIESGDGK
jgi:hypothetical protein